MPSTSAIEGSSGVVGSLWATIRPSRASNICRSVNVPPISIPIRTGLVEAFIDLNSSVSISTYACVNHPSAAWMNSTGTAFGAGVVPAIHVPRRPDGPLQRPTQKAQSVRDSHPLLLAGLPAHSENLHRVRRSQLNHSRPRSDESIGRHRHASTGSRTE